VLAALGDRADVRGLQDRPDLAAGYRAPPVVGIEHHGLERLLPEAVRGQARVAEDRARAVPWPGQVDIDRDT